jgi:DNA-binding transcriptional ArsR family regulator
MAVTLIIESVRPEWISVRASPLAELCAALHALDEPGHHPSSQSWVSAVHSDIPGDLLTRATVWAPLWGAFRARYLLPLAAGGAERSLDAELDCIARLPVEAFTNLTVQALIGKNLTSGEPPLNAAAVLPRLRLISLGRYDLALRLIEDPARLRGDLLDFLGAFAAAAFDEEWRRVRGVVDPDVQARLRQLRLRGTTGAFDGIGAVADDPPRVVFDKLYHARARLDARMPCVLVPSVHGDPHLVIKHVPGYPAVVQYPVVPTAEAVPFEEMRRRLAALQDPTRLLICRDILRHPSATAELATRLGMTAPQISRHLRQLREAGLVSTHRHGAAVYYRLNVDVIRRLGPDLLSGLRH